MPLSRFGRLAALGLVSLLAACGAGQPTPAPATDPAASAASPSPAATAAPRLETTFADGRSIGLAAGADGAVYAAVGTDDGLLVAASSDGGRSWSQPVLASGETEALVSPVERPAIAASAGGGLAVAWLEHYAGGANVWLARSADGGATFAAPQKIASPGAHETAMVSLAFDPGGTPLLAWLEDGALATASVSAEATAPQVVDELVCECCQPALLSGAPVGGGAVLGYRNLDRHAEGDERDMFVQVLDGAGAPSGPLVRVSDQSWRIDACPISAPALASHGRALYAAWMDGRDDPGNAGSRSDIWLASSDTGGRDWSRNQRVNPAEPPINAMPSLAADGAGRLFVAWQTLGAGRQALVVARSDDGGATWQPPRALVDSEDGMGRGSPTAPVLVAAGGALYLAWIDALGAHVLALPAE